MNIINVLPKGINLFFWFATLILFLIIIRLILCIFKVVAVKQGEADYRDESKEKFTYISFRDEKFRHIFAKSFFSCYGDLHIDDYFLPTIVGLVELILFPILFFKRWDVIAFWLGLKTAGHWGLWNKSRTSYNRFLFGNILSLAFAYILYRIFFMK